MARILLADDDLTQLDLQAWVLESAGHSVEVAFSPAEALRCAERPFDVLIMDLRFHNAAGTQDAGEGLALIRGIRETGCTVPILVLSGWPEDLYGHAEEKMVSRIILKPVPPTGLLAAIDGLVPGAPS